LDNFGKQEGIWFVKTISATVLTGSLLGTMPSPGKTGHLKTEHSRFGTPVNQSVFC